MRNAHKILDGETEEKKRFCIPRLRWKDNTKMHLKGIRWTELIWLRIGSNAAAKRRQTETKL
jgi:hypothetical protein